MYAGAKQIEVWIKKLPTMNDKPNRIERKASSDLEKLGDVGLKGVLGLLPGGSYLHDLLKLRKDAIRDAVRKADEETLDAFFSDLLNGDTALDPSLVNALINDRDFHSLLRACIADIEAEKRDAYAALARSIACRVVGGEWNRHFILSLKDMSMRELEYLRSAYVAKHFRLVPKGSSGSTVQESDFLETGQPGSYQSIAISNLIARGFVYEGKLSPTGEDFVRACSNNIKLTPTAVGYREWSDQTVAIISYELGDNVIGSRAIEIEEVLRNYQIKTSIFAITRNSQQQARLFTTQGILLLGQKTEALDEHSKALAEYASSVPLIVVKMTEPCGTLPPEVRISKDIGYESDFQSTLKTLTAAVLNFRNQSK